MERLYNIEEMPKASVSPSRSIEDSKEVVEQKRAIVELSNTSILHGYDMAVELLEVHGNTEAVEILKVNRGIIEVGLKDATRI